LSRPKSPLEMPAVTDLLDEREEEGLGLVLLFPLPPLTDAARLLASLLPIAPRTDMAALVAPFVVRVVAVPLASLSVSAIGSLLTNSFCSN
jgi:hypothetical protein